MNWGAGPGGNSMSDRTGRALGTNGSDGISPSSIIRSLHSTSKSRISLVATGRTGDSLARALGDIFRVWFLSHRSWRAVNPSRFLLRIASLRTRKLNLSIRLCSIVVGQSTFERRSILSRMLSSDMLDSIQRRHRVQLAAVASMYSRALSGSSPSRWDISRISDANVCRILGASLFHLEARSAATTPSKVRVSWAVANLPNTRRTASSGSWVTQYRTVVFQSFKGLPFLPSFV